MKLNKNFILRQVAEHWIVLPLAEKTVDFSGILTLNESGVLLWNALEKGGDRQSLVDALTSEYEVTAEKAAADVDAFIGKLVQAGCIDEK